MPHHTPLAGRPLLWRGARCCELDIGPCRPLPQQVSARLGHQQAERRIKRAGSRWGDDGGLGIGVPGWGASSGRALDSRLHCTCAPPLLRVLRGIRGVGEGRVCPAPPPPWLACGRAPSPATALAFAVRGRAVASTRDAHVRYIDKIAQARPGQASTSTPPLAGARRRHARTATSVHAAEGVVGVGVSQQRASRADACNGQGLSCMAPHSQPCCNWRTVPAARRAGRGAEPASGRGACAPACHQHGGDALGHPRWRPRGGGHGGGRGGGPGAGADTAGDDG